MRFYAVALEWQVNQSGEESLLCAGVMTFRSVGRRADMIVRAGARGLIGEIVLDQRQFLRPDETKPVVYRVGGRVVTPLVRIYTLLIPRRA